MKFIDLENWDRIEHYNYFKMMDYPHFSICGNVDITQFRKFIKENNYSFFVSLLYVATKTANSIKEFRYRIKEDKVIEYEVLNPKFSYMTLRSLFSYLTVEYNDNFKEFLLKTNDQIEINKDTINLTQNNERDDILFITSTPLVSFTSIVSPINLNPVDSIPKIAFGKYFEENDKIMMPLSVQAHHSFVDGAHVGQYFIEFQNIINNPKDYLK